MKKLSVVILLVLLVGTPQVQAQKLGTELGYVEALVFSGTGKHLIYLTAEIPDQKCDETDAAVLDPKIFTGTSAFTNLQLASIFRQEVQLAVDGCINARDLEGPVKEGDEKKTFPRIVDIIFYSGIKIFP